MTPKILISHSAREADPGPGWSYRQAIHQALAAEDAFQVLLDEQDFVPGTAWRSVNDEWIWNCDGAVLLLTENALRSDYVRYEALFLRQRWLADKGFPFILVRLPDVTEADVDRHFQPLQLNEVQHLVVADATAPAATAAEVLRLLRPLVAARAARHPLEAELVDLLRLGTEDQGLAQLSNGWLDRPPPPNAHEDRCQRVARFLMSLGDRGLDDRFDWLYQLLPGLRTLAGTDLAQRVLDLLWPFCWVSPEAAVRLADAVAREPPDPRCIVWRRSWILAERMYLLRALCRRSQHLAQASDRVGGDLDEAMDHVRACLAEAVGLDGDANVPRVQRQIARRLNRNQPVVLVFPFRAADRALIDAVLAAWPQVLLILHDETIGADALHALPDMFDLDFLEPELSEDREDDARSDWGDLMQQAGADSDAIRGGQGL